MFKRLRSLALPAAAAAMLAFAAYHVSLGYQTAPKLPPPAEPARNPYGKTIAGSGIIEAQTQNISLGAVVPGVVTEVFVTVDAKVTKGQPLFKLDTRHLLAELELRKAAVALAQSQLDKLKRMPREEEKPPAQAKVDEAKAMLAEQEDLLARARQLFPKVTTQEEMTKREALYAASRQQLAKAQAELALLLAGAWGPDQEIAKATLAQAQAQLRQTETEIDRHTVRAPVDGRALQVNVRPGEFVGAVAGQGLVMLGDLTKLHVRVDIDEHDIPRFRPGGPATAYLRGHPDWKFRLSFVRVEPFVIPKRSLTGDNTERVDTRVLQVIYAIDEARENLYVGQQADVFIDAGAAKAHEPGT